MIYKVLSRKSDLPVFVKCDKVKHTADGVIFYNEDIESGTLYFLPHLYIISYERLLEVPERSEVIGQ